MTERWDAELYDRHHGFVSALASELVDELAPMAGERVLDLGCGTGTLAKEIARRGAHVVGVDARPEMIAAARATLPGGTFVVADARTFTLDEPVDAVFSNATLHWVKPPEAALAAVHRALRPGGRFVLEMGGEGNVRAIRDAVTRVLARAGRTFDDPWYFPSLRAYVALLSAQGFVVERARSFVRPTPLDEGARGLAHWLTMFGGAVLAGLDDEARGRVIAAVEDEARPALFREGRWVADYVRLRVTARRPDDGP